MWAVVAIASAAAFVIGWLAANVLTLFSATVVAAILRGPTEVEEEVDTLVGWTIDGVVYSLRPLNRAAMDSLAAVRHIDLPIFMANLTPGAEEADQPDPDAVRERIRKEQSRSLDSLYATAQMLLIDDDGGHPPMDKLEEELTVDDAREIVTAALGS